METVVQDTPASEDKMVETKKKDRAPLPPMKLDESGIISPQDSGEEFRLANIMLDSGSLPSSFKNISQVLMAMQYCKVHKIPPWVGIQQLMIVNGRLTSWGEIPLGLVRRSGMLKRFEEILFDKSYNQICFENKNLHVPIFGANCVMEDIDGRVTSRSFTTTDAETAGLLGKDIWKKYPKRMIQMRARGWTLKDGAPEVLSGLALLEYDFDKIVEEDPSGGMRVVGGTAADEMNLLLTDDKAGSVIEGEKATDQESTITQSN